MACDRERNSGVKLEGRKSNTETNPSAAEMAKRLRRANPTTGRRLSYRDTAAKLFEAGHMAKTGRERLAIGTVQNWSAQLRLA